MTTRRMSNTEWQQHRLAMITEAEFDGMVLRRAHMLGWRSFHPYDMRKSSPGYPDRTIARRGRLIIAELKTAKGKWRDGQREWLAELAGDTPDEWHFDRTVTRHDGQLTIACWTPKSWPTIETALGGPIR